MTKLYVAEPIVEPKPELDPQIAGRLYHIDADTEAVMIKQPRDRGVKWDIPRENRYSTGLGDDFDLELNIYDAERRQPIRGVEVITGATKGFTDRTGRAVLNLKRGNHEVIVSGNGFVEAGDFAPTPVTFEKLLITAEMDSDATYTVYSSGQIVRGERRELANQGPAHHGQPAGNTEATQFLKDHWIGLGLAGLGLAGVAYYVGKSNNKAP